MYHECLDYCLQMGEFMVFTILLHSLTFICQFDTIALYISMICLEAGYSAAFNLIPLAHDCFSCLNRHFKVVLSSSPQNGIGILKTILLNLQWYGNFRNRNSSSLGTTETFRPFNDFFQVILCFVNFIGYSFISKTEKIPTYFLNELFQGGRVFICFFLTQHCCCL